MADWSTVQSLAFTVGPIAGPWLYSQYNKYRAQARSTGPPVPVPAALITPLFILVIAALYFIISGFAIYLSPENVFIATQSRMQTATNVLFERIRKLRPGEVLSAGDEILRSKLNSVEGRCLYLKYGPQATLNCLWCEKGQPETYFYYSISDILWAHASNFLVLGLATSTAIGGRLANRWRNVTVMASVGLALVNLYLVNTFDWKSNSTATGLDDMQFFYWDSTALRSVCLAVLDLTLCGLLWASSTKRMFAVTLTPAERVDMVIRTMSNFKGKVNASGIIRNTVNHNQSLRARTNEYWRKECELMSEVMAGEEVVEAVNNALTNRISMTRVEGDAKAFAESVVQAST